MPLQYGTYKEEALVYGKFSDPRIRVDSELVPKRLTNVGIFSRSFRKGAEVSDPAFEPVFCIHLGIETSSFGLVLFSAVFAQFIVSLRGV